MKELFLMILNMSVAASWLILAVISIRFLMQKGNAPKNLRYLLWLFVAIRLLCPFTIESTMSLLPSQESVSDVLQVLQDTDTDKLISQKEETVSEHIHGIENIVLSEVGDTSGNEGIVNDRNDVVVENQQDVTINVATMNADVQVDWILMLSRIWCIGIIGLLLYGLISYVALYKKVRASIYTDNGVWICDAIHSPFLFGILHPRIYMPSDIMEGQFPYIIAHEKEHMKCYDHLWKPLGFFVLAMHWFNPLVWTAYVLMCKDIEYACDERVIRNMDNVQKKQYTESLLLCSSPRHDISACPVAFGEIGIKERIKNVVNYKKPATWIVGLTIVACVVVAICFMTSPPKDEADQNEDKIVTNNEPFLNSDGIAVDDGIPGDDVNDDTTYIQSVQNKVLFETIADLDHDGIDDLLTEDGALLDEKWEQYMYVWGDHNVSSIYWLQEIFASDLEQWYIGYDGLKLQRIEGNDREQAAHGPSTNLDTIYYKADDNDDLQSILYKMIEAMLVARMEPEDGRTYTITDYEIEDCEIVEISEHIWLIPYLNGYYKFDGIDLVSYENLLEDYGDHAINGCVPFISQGSQSQFWYLLIEKDGVYRLQNFSRMMSEYE